MINVMKEKVRVNVYVSKELKEWLQGEVDDMGTTLSGYVNMLIAEKRNQKSVISQLPELMEQLKQLEKAQEKTSQ